jgi:phosphoserine aminotransferase
MDKPTLKPVGKCYSAGPCQKHPGWSLEELKGGLFGRSHRSDVAKKRLLQVIEESRELLGIPADYHIGITPGSDTGAFEMAMWSLVGAKPLVVLAWDVFGKDWVHDAQSHMQLKDLDCRLGEVGHLPDLANIDPDHDVIFTWNGSSSGIVMDRHDWISSQRTGLTFCDATSAAFAMDLPWDKLDVTTYSWQKCLGSEAGHGMIVLSPRAMERLKTYIPPWPMPKLFRLADHGKVREAVFIGETINTPSMMCVEDVLSVFKWVRSIGGLGALVARSQRNLDVLKTWIASRGHWVRFTAEVESQRSCTSMCIKFCAPEVTALSRADQWVFASGLAELLDVEDVAYDIRGHILDEPNIRIWGGPTVESSDIDKLLPWIEWAYGQVLNNK